MGLTIVIHHRKSSHPKREEHHQNRRQAPVEGFRIGVHHLPREPAIAAHQSRYRKQPVQEWPQRVGVERQSPVAMDEGGEASGQPAAWAWPMKQSRARTRRKTKLGVSAVTDRFRLEIDRKAGNHNPTQKPPKMAPKKLAVGHGTKANQGQPR